MALGCLVSIILVYGVDMSTGDFFGNPNFPLGSWSVAPDVSSVSPSMGDVTISNGTYTTDTGIGYTYVDNSWINNYTFNQTAAVPEIQLGKHRLNEEMLDKLMLLLEAIECLPEDSELKQLMDSIAMMKKMKGDGHI